MCKIPPTLRVNISLRSSCLSSCCTGNDIELNQRTSEVAKSNMPKEEPQQPARSLRTRITEHCTLL